MPDVILLDWNMPVMSGMEFLSELRSQPLEKRPIVVFCTTENDMAHIRAAIDAGADEYIMKPFDRDVIEAKLSRSEEHTSELQSLMRISYAVFCLKKKTNITKNTHHNTLHNTTIQHQTN